MNNVVVLKENDDTNAIDPIIELKNSNLLILRHIMALNNRISKMEKNLAELSLSTNEEIKSLKSDVIDTLTGLTMDIDQKFCRK